MQASNSHSKQATQRGDRSAEEIADIKRADRWVKRLIRKFDKANWARLAAGVTHAADAGYMKKAFSLLNEGLNRKPKEGSTPFHEQCAAARDATASLTLPDPPECMDMPDLPTREWRVLSEVIKAYTDGSKLQSRVRDDG